MMIKKYKNFTPIFTILGKNEDDIIKKINLNKSENVIYEIRIDSLMKEGISLNNIIYILNNIVSIFSEFEFLFTIRTTDEGGLIDLSKDYFTTWWEIYSKTTSQYIDLKYEALKKDSKARYTLESLIDYNNTKVITSYHSFKKDFNINKTSDLILSMMGDFGDIIKIAIDIEEKNDVLLFMNYTHLLQDRLISENKEAIFIIMGDMGKISRVWPEYSNSKYMFYSLDNKKNNVGQISLEELEYYRGKIGLKN